MILGDSAGRHMETTIPKWVPNIPAIAVPESGTIPVSFTGFCLESAAEAGDEITVEFK